MNAADAELYRMEWAARMTDCRAELVAVRDRLGTLVARCREVGQPVLAEEAQGILGAFQRCEAGVSRAVEEVPAGVVTPEPVLALEGAAAPIPGAEPMPAGQAATIAASG